MPPRSLASALRAKTDADDAPANLCPLSPSWTRSHSIAATTAELLAKPSTGIGGRHRRETFKRGLQSELDRIKAAHPGKRLSLWFEDEARFGQKGRVCHRWFTRSQRPAGLCDQRYTWAHLFAAVQPETGEAFALVLPELNTAAMQLFVDHFAATRPADEHAVMIMDQADWHITDNLIVPSNMSILLLPPYSPELNPVERVWLYIRERHLSHRLLHDYNAIVDALCSAWNKLTTQRIASLTSYPYLRHQLLSRPV